MKLKKRILLIGILAVILIIAGIVLWILFRYTLNDGYKDFLSQYSYEEGNDFSPLSEKKSDVEGMVLVSENEVLKLYTNTATGDVAIYDKRNKQTIYSNPPKADEDAIASSTNLNYMKSQLVVEYFNDKNTISAYDSYSMCTQTGQIRAESINNGIRYIYDFADRNTETGIVPVYITQENLDKLLDTAPDDTVRRYIKTKYRESKDKPGFLELSEGARNGVATVRKLNTYLEDMGFTVDDYNQYMEDAGADELTIKSIEIPLEYRLDNDAVDVTIPCKEIIEAGGMQIYRIEMLRYFGAGASDEKGYMVVPDGSGAVINFNNGKGDPSIPGYITNIYGIDLLDANLTKLENIKKSSLGLYGICRENSSVLATMEDGASLVLLSADVAGKYSTYNNIYPTYVLRSYNVMSMFGSTSSQSDIPIIEKDMVQSDITMKYTMLTDEYKGYSGIANYYRERLEREGVLQKATEQGDIPFYYDILTGAKVDSYFIGIQYDGLTCLTTFDEAGNISDELKNAGVSNQVANLQGWFDNDGYFNDTPDKLKVPAKYGGKSDLVALNDKMSTDGNKLYTDVAIQHVSFASDRFNYKLEGSRYYGAGYVAAFGMTNPATLRQTSGIAGYYDVRYRLMSPKFLPFYVEKFVDKENKLDVDGISLRDLGDQLHSDKKRTEIINREQALDVVLSQLDLIDTTSKNIMLNCPNDYAFKYADDILNVPMSACDYRVTDYTIPLYQMILHGHVNYSSGVLNLNGLSAYDDNILEMIDTGTSPHFVFSWNGSEQIKYSSLLDRYATKFSNQKDSAVSTYNEVNSVLSKVSGSQIVFRETVDGVNITTYSNGVKIYVNMTEKDGNANNVKVPAKSYVVM